MVHPKSSIVQFYVYYVFLPRFSPSFFLVSSALFCARKGYPDILPSSFDRITIRIKNVPGRYRLVNDSVPNKDVFSAPITVYKYTISCLKNSLYWTKGLVDIYLIWNRGWNIFRVTYPLGESLKAESKPKPNGVIASWYFIVIVLLQSNDSCSFFA